MGVHMGVTSTDNPYEHLSRATMRSSTRMTRFATLRYQWRTSSNYDGRHRRHCGVFGLGGFFFSSQQTDLPPHDVGGSLPPHYYHDTPINTTPQPLQHWEQQCHSLFSVLASKGVVRTDQLRRAIESLAVDQYHTWTYYERWSAGLGQLLLERNILSTDELQEALFGEANVSSSNEAPRFAIGDTVRVKRYDDRVAVAWRRPHLRTPGYVYGVLGTVVYVDKMYRDPSFLAFGDCTAPRVRLYRVQVRQSDVWPEHHTSSHTQHDTIELDIYEHWLEAATMNDVSQPKNASNLFDHTHTGEDCTHHHDHHLHHHTHEARPVVEARAVQAEGPPRPGQALHEVLYRLLRDKNVVTAEEVQRMCEYLDTAGKRLDGATLVVKAWLDDRFKELLLTDAAQAASQLDISVSNPNAPTALTVVENTLQVHNLVVCTLCSCHPSGLLGIAPSWYTSSVYRARSVRQPRTVLAEFGCHTIPPTKRIRVVDSTADHRYLVLPERPTGTSHWSADQLKAIVTRDSMIGVSVPMASR